ncbi:hypothetical protein TSAR_004732 [Trichomalopsis sarcophagae]|uniref:MD-2-related lipid-recognition domain-containing protein n=1 Tax=Trichomalopsis sarcophagae TaxID=543379 RepID=A0A232ED99_9HYME|nr:hypothetical protein TSAR_004732 [Trichomalopsis sarcophagae]
MLIRKPRPLLRNEKKSLEALVSRIKQIFVELPGNLCYLHLLAQLRTGGRIRCKVRGAHGFARFTRSPALGKIIYLFFVIKKGAVKMMRSFALVALFCAATRAVEFKDCGSTAGNFDKVEISNCDLSAPACVLKKGTEASIGLHFTPSKKLGILIPTRRFLTIFIIPDKASSRVTAVVHGIIEDIDVPFPIPNAEACFDNHSGVVCPLPAGTGTSYHATLPVLAKYPTVSVTVKWELKDEKGANIVCVEIPVSIQ